MTRVDLSGTVLDGRYRVIEPIAEGAMGVVYKAERLKLGRIVAIKVLHEVLPSELRSRQRFEVEAIAMAKLEHPHCAAVLDVGIQDDCPYVVMDFVAGPNLKEVIAEGPMEPTRAAEIVRQVLSGLAAAHEHGIIHRDIKPANLVLSHKAGLGDHVKILDFGLARLSQDVSNLTTGIVVGTPSYMAPEQIRGTKLDGRVDLYACGVLLFELLTAKKPFVSPKDDPIEVCTMHLRDPAPRMSDMLPGAEFGELEDIVARALSKSADDRYATAVEFAAALDAVAPRRRIATPVAGVPIAGIPIGSSPAIAPPDAAALRRTPPAGVPQTPRPAMDVSEGIAEAATNPPPPRPSHPALEASMDVSDGMLVASATTNPPHNASVTTPLGSFAVTPAVAPAVETPAPPPPSPPPMATPPAPSPPPIAPPQGLATSFDLSLAIPQSPRERAIDPHDRSIITSAADLAAPPAGKLERPDDGSSELPGSLYGGRRFAPPPRPTNPPTVAFAGAPPAGPSPLAVAPTVNGTHTTTPSTGFQARPRRRMTKRQFLVIVGTASAFLVVLVIALAVRGGGSTSTDGAAAPRDAAPKADPPARVVEDPGADAYARLQQLIASGRGEALDVALAARRTFPDDGRFALAAGKLYFGRLYWNDGLRQLRDAVRLQPAYKSDPDLIKTVLRGFITTPGTNPDIAAFLEELGAAARPYLEETARDHPSQMIRTRAAAQLRRMR